MVVGVLGRGIVAADEPVVRADDLGLARGDGCFESCRVVTDDTGASVVERLDAHLVRLQRSLDVLAIPGDVAACRGLILLVAEHWSTPGEAVVKVMVTRGVEQAGVEQAGVEQAGVERAGVERAGVEQAGVERAGVEQAGVDGASVEGTGAPTVVATVKPIGTGSLRQRREGVRAVTLARGTDVDTFSGAPWLLGGVKSLSYALNMAALREAVRRGAEDAIWTARDGTVLEAPTATVVWAQGNRLTTTPTGATGILAGTTMAALFDGAAADGVEVGVDTILSDDLPSTDGIWLVSAVRGVAEVVELDGSTRVRQPERTARLNAYAGF